MAEYEQPADGETKKKGGKSVKKKLEIIRERYKRAVDADQRNRREALEDFKFTHVPGEQWDPLVRTERGADRPCYEFNKIRVTVKRVVNDMRANRPQGKVRGAEESDKPTAEIYEGLIRNIWSVSDGDTVIDAAAEYQVGAGMGAWRVSVDYADDGAFEQDIRIEAINNPFCLYSDAGARDPLKRDAMYWFLTTRMSKEAYEAAYPNKKTTSFDSETEFDDEDWEDEETVRVVEYWYKEPVTKTIYQLSDGRTVDEPPPPVAPEALMQAQAMGAPPPPMVARERKVATHAIKMCIASGDAILEEQDWAGSQFPFVQVYGESMVVDGRLIWFGLPRFAKDAQRAYNYSRTSAVETSALAPQAKWWATPAQALGHSELWGQAHKKNFPFMLANPDPQQPGFPQPMSGAQVPAALIAEIQMASEDIKAVTGIFDTSLGAESNETSGRAIMARQRQGEIAVFNYMDNLSKGIRRTWEILVDLIPKVYDTERQMRILGFDGAEKYAKINALDSMTGEVLNDLSRGKYDVAVTVGPSFANQREAAAEVYMGMAQANPGVFQVAGDLLFKSLDLPYSDQIADRLKTLLPPQIQQMESGGNVPPEVAQGMAQVDQAMQQVQMMAQQMQQDAAGIEQGKAELQKMVSDLEVKKAQFQADVAKQLAQMQLRDADFTVKQAQAGADEGGKKVEADREKFGVQMQEGLAAIQQQANEMLAEIVRVLAEMQAHQQPQVIVANEPRSKRVVVERINGKLVGTVEES